MPIQRNRQNSATATEIDGSDEAVVEVNGDAAATADPPTEVVAAIGGKPAIAFVAALMLLAATEFSRFPSASLAAIVTIAGLPGVPPMIKAFCLMWLAVKLLPALTAKLPIPSRPPPKLSWPPPEIVSVLALFQALGEAKTTVTFCVTSSERMSGSSTDGNGERRLMDCWPDGNSN